MRTSELAKRYAKAIYDLAEEQKTQDKTFSDLRSLAESFERDSSILNFFSSPIVLSEQKEAALTAAFANSGISGAAKDFLLTLARKERLSLLAEIVQAYQDRIDSNHGIGRGTVRSATALNPAARQEVENIVEKVLKKKVVLTYKIDPGTIGGLVAQVGSYTFDDSIQSHLHRMSEELNRRSV